jgi:hypothetical protein
MFVKFDYIYLFIYFRSVIIWVLTVSLLLSRKCIIHIYDIEYKDVFEWWKAIGNISAIFGSQ